MLFRIIQNGKVMLGKKESYRTDPKKVNRFLGKRARTYGCPCCPVRRKWYID